MKILEATTKNIIDASRIVKKGGLAIFPTETVYGLAATIQSPKAIEAIFKTKMRPW